VTSNIEAITQLAVNDRSVRESVKPAVAPPEDQQDQQDQQSQTNTAQLGQRLQPGRRPLFRT
jgi:hypothetical protein